ncbi:GyrI-like domain-containing protein [Microbacterium sp. HD4P20]|uniref:GyrI-like domain-containing protein n=1 Tax=Microbacterium sp. HD4P20 TaxID=2864874 RepID=UPI001C642DAF|nr:GyrI-like domain-containing protein [Microbacterium sp. HD4P20]MCP2636443.1 GyrI-like domain-containing protein [Microbacterium sp. HD4P20]
MKIDFKKEIAAYSARRGVFDIIEVPPLRYLMIDGHGDPNTQAYGDAISTIFPVAYKLKFLSKRELDRDYVVMPLEAVWWSDDMSSFTSDRDKSKWDWTALNMVPDWITDELFARAVAAAGEAPVIDRIRLGTLDEGRCVQTLHVGPFDEEGPVLADLHDRFIPSQGLRMTGKHHEIYLSDIRRTDPSKLRTILRQPVADAAS